jgi:putative transposase
LEIACEINQEADNPYSKRQIAQALEFGRNSYYYQSKLAMKDKLVANEIEIWHQEDDTLGYRKLAVLMEVNHKKARRIMHKYGLKARRQPKAYKYPGKSSTVYPNLPKDEALVPWVEFVFSDIFEFKLRDGTKVRGCFALLKKTRQVLSLVFDYSMRATLVVDTINRIDFVDPLTVFHSDQGKQFGAKITYEAQMEKGFLLSMSRAGTPTDNPFAERFVGLFKLAVVKRYSYATLGDFLEQAERWVNFYNQTRPHEGLGQLSPNQFALQNNYPSVPYLPLF